MGNAILFFWEKTLYQWGDPTFNSEKILNYGNVIHETSIVYKLISTTYLTLFAQIYQIAVIIGSICFAWMRKRRIQIEEMMLAVIFIGGFLFHLFWEASPSYTVTYFFLLIPYAVIGYTEILDKFNVKPISYYWINDFLCVAFKYHYSYDFYTENGLFRRKLYAPLEKKKKWINNGGAICQGESMLPYEGDLLIITKSLKDVMTLYSLGITAIAPPSESSFLPLGYYNKQKKRFKKIVLFFDNDQTGIKKAKKFSEEYNLPYIYIPEGDEKDISDYRKLHGEEKTKKLINKLLYEKETIFH